MADPRDNIYNLAWYTNMICYSILEVLSIEGWGRGTDLYSCMAYLWDTAWATTAILCTPPQQDSHWQCMLPECVCMYVQGSNIKAQVKRLLQEYIPRLRSCTQCSYSSDQWHWLRALASTAAWSSMVCVSVCVYVMSGYPECKVQWRENRYLGPLSAPHWLHTVKVVIHRLSRGDASRPLCQIQAMTQKKLNTHTHANAVPQQTVTNNTRVL